MLNPNDLAAMRATLDTTRVSGTLVIMRRTEVSDGRGGYTQGTVPVTGGTVAYRLVQVSGMERAMAGRMGSVSVWRFGLPRTPEVLPSDRLLADGVYTYEVTSSNLPRAWTLEQVVEAVRL